MLTRVRWTLHWRTLPVRYVSRILVQAGVGGVIILYGRYESGVFVLREHITTSLRQIPTNASRIRFHHLGQIATAVESRKQRMGSVNGHRRMSRKQGIRDYTR